MEERIEKLRQAPYWIIDILPEQVPADSPGQYFAVENYFLEGEQLAAIKQKHINLILKLNCYKSISMVIDGVATDDPHPARFAEEMRRRYLYIMVDDAMILSEPDDTHMTLFNPGERLLNLVKRLAASEGLFVWELPT